MTMPFKDSKNRNCGFINIEEKEKSAKFTRRYLRLDKTSGLLQWFEDDPSNTDATPCGTVDVNYITTVDIPSKPKLKAKHCFVVNTPMRKYFLQANDEPDMKDWVETLNNASRIVVSDDEEQERDAGEENSDAENFCYKTEVVAGVVVQKKVEFSEDDINAQPKDQHTGNITSPPSKSTSVSSYQPSPKVFRKGYAVKQGFVRKNWKRRYFLLDESGFSYFKFEQEKEPIRHIPLSDIRAANLEDGSLMGHKDNLFTVVTIERTYYIQADSVTDMEAWVSSFNEAIRLDKVTNSNDSATESWSGNTGNQAGPRRVKMKVEATLSATTLPSSKADQGLAESPGLSKHPAAVRYSSLTTSSPETDPEGGKKKNHPRKPKKLRRKGSCSGDSAAFSSSVESLSSGVGALSQTPVVGSDGRAVSTERKQEDSKRSPMQNVRGKPDNSLLKASPSFSHSSDNSGTKVPLSSKSFSVTTLPARSKPTRPFLLDPDVDHRSAVRPSAVKKKRNPGILFSLNNMLNKKMEKMKKTVPVN